MTTLYQTFRNGIKAALIATPGLGAQVETSTLRAFTRSETALVLHSGKEFVSDDGPIGCATRVRELLCSAQTAGDARDDVAESIFEAALPVILGYAAAGLVSIQETGTDEPKYVPGDLGRMIVTKRFLLTYQTRENSLSE